MARLWVTDRAGNETVVEGETGISVMRVIRGAGFDEMLALCGGELACATCHVLVDEAFLSTLPQMSEDEHDLLDSSEHRQANSRLSCQLTFGPALDGLKVKIGPEE